MILMIREFEAAPSSGTSSQMQSNALDDKTLESIRRPGNDYVPSLQTLRPFIEVVTHDPTLIDGRVNLRVNERDTVYAGGMMNNDGARRVDWGAEHKMDNGMTIGGMVKAQ
uniref:Uncharacterized protein n=1 Tax=Romanomermis culicivorax TaxID=13658 RepID=A0A915KWL0_ROMCU